MASLTRHSAAQEATPAATPLAFDIATMPLEQAGKLTVHTDDPVYEPWFVDNDPANGEGFESALVYALAEEMGFARDQVAWGRTAFADAFAPGAKDFDFYITEVSITAQREEAVSFSDPYYSTQLVLIAADDSPAQEAQSLADLRLYRFGTVADSLYAQYITETIRPEPELVLFDTNAKALEALSGGQIDAGVESLPIAVEVVTDELENLNIVGTLPDCETDLGMVFERDSPLVPYVNQALENIRADGTWEKLVAEWLPAPPDFREIAP